jgi:Holliday junction resolvase RusA-like endonuclease
MDREQTIIGQCPSKPNCYRVIRIAGHGSLCKQRVLKEYEQSFYMQCGKYRNAGISGLFSIEIDVYCKSMSHDLDNTLKIVLDCLQQCKAISNDNRCVHIDANKFLDKNNPRIEFTLRTIEQ